MEGNEGSPSTSLTQERLPAKRFKPFHDTLNNEKNLNKTFLPRFLVFTHGENGKNLSKVSPFLINKIITNSAGKVNSIKKLRDGSVLVETATNKQTEALFKVKQFLPEIPVTVQPHLKLNSSKGVIFCPDLVDISKEEILFELKNQNVIDLYKITRKAQDQITTTPLIILTFGTPTIPPTINVGFYRLSVRKYVPPPMRCYLCQSYGHTKGRCVKTTPICGYCGEKLHPGTPCLRTFCTPCNNDSHPSFSRTCPKFLEEKEIIELSVDKNISYFAAKAQFEKQKLSKTTSFASVVQTNSSCSSCEELKQTVKVLTEQIVALTGKLESLAAAEKSKRKKQIENTPEKSTSSSGTIAAPIVRPSSSGIIAAPIVSASSSGTIAAPIASTSSSTPISVGKVLLSLPTSSEDELPLAQRMPFRKKNSKIKGQNRNAAS